MSAEAPRPSVQEASLTPVTSGENILLSSTSLPLSEGIVVSRKSKVRKAGAFAGAVLAVATIGSSLNLGNRANAQGPDYVPPSPAASVEPIPSIDPNGETAQGEVPCETDVQPAAQVGPDASIVPGGLIASIEGVGNVASPAPSIAVESPAPLPTGGDLLGGDTEGEDCEPENPYTIEALLELGFDPIKLERKKGDEKKPGDKQTFEEILQEVAPIIVQDPSISSFIEDADEYIEITMVGMRDMMLDKTLKNGGRYIASGVWSMINAIKNPAAQENPEIAEAFFKLADATRRLGQGYLDFGTKNKVKKDEIMDSLIIEYKPL